MSAPIPGDQRFPQPDSCDQRKRRRTDCCFPCNPAVSVARADVTGLTNDRLIWATSSVAISKDPYAAAPELTPRVGHPPDP